MMLKFKVWLLPGPEQQVEVRVMNAIEGLSSGHLTREEAKVIGEQLLRFHETGEVKKPWS